MDTPDKTRDVLSSLESFQALRTVLIYLRSVSVVFESEKAGGHLAAIGEEIQANAPEQLTEQEIRHLSMECTRAAICTHLALLYTALGFYEALVEANPALRHEKLDSALEAARRNDLLDSMRELRNAVFHVRPSTQTHRLVLDVVRGAAENTLAWNTLEDLLFDATEEVFANPEVLFQERQEVLEEGFRRALAYYDEHLADRQE